MKKSVIRLYATFNGIKDIKPDETSIFAGKLQLMWTNVKDDTGQPIIGEYHCNRAKLFDNITLRKGNRYVLECKKINGTKIQHPTKIMNTNKNPICSIIRKAFDDYTFIKGKFKGKWLSKMTILEKDEVKRYLLYLGKNTNNEATVINILNMLKILDDEQKEIEKQK